MKTPTQLRDDEFIARCKKGLERCRQQGRRPVYAEIVSEVLDQEASSYFVDFTYAKYVLYKALRTGVLPRATYSCAGLWEDMIVDLKCLRAKHPDRDVADDVLDLCMGYGGHPRYYISRRRGLQIARPHLDAILYA